MSITDEIRRIREGVQAHGPLLIDERESLTRGSTGYSKGELLDSLIEFYNAHHRWPRNSTEYRDDTMLPHSATVKRHFGSLKEAHRQAEDKMRSG